jgi:hypothetical protein
MVFSGGGKNASQVRNATESPHHYRCVASTCLSLARKQHTSLAYVDLEGE